jgi:two-component system, NarL family, sensor kinase
MTSYINRFFLPFFPLGISLFILLFSPVSLIAQTQRIDSLRNRLENTVGFEKMQLAINLCKEKNSFPADSLLKYIVLADSINKEIKDVRSAFEIDYYKTCYVQVTGDIDSAFLRCDLSLAELKNQKNLRDLYRKYKTFKGALLIRSDQVKEAIALFYDVLKDAEINKDTFNILASQNGLGWANMELSNYNEAISWLKKALLSSGNESPYIIYPLSNLAACYNSIQKNDSALYYVNKAIKLGNISGDLKALANAYAIKSDILIDLKKPGDAEEMLKKGVDIRKQIGDQFYVVSDMYQLGIFYANTHQCEKGISICKEGLAIAERYNFSSKLIILYEALADNYKECDNYVAYADVLNTLLVLKDSLYLKNSAEALAEMQTKYEVENKENIILKQEYGLTKRNYLIYGSFLLFMLTGIISILVFKQYKSKQHSLSLREVNQARENERKRIAAELHDNIGTQLSYISRKTELINTETGNLNDKQITSLKDIASSARRSISDLRETIWALNKESIGINDLADRLKAFVHQQLDGQNEPQLHVEENIEKNLQFTSIESLNIFRILQEAVHNSIQHSQCKNLYLAFESFKDGQWKISIRDDGKGFNVNKHYENHFGLENMMQRANETGSKLTINSEPDKGTLIVLGGTL